MGKALDMQLGWFSIWSTTHTVNEEESIVTYDAELLLPFRGDFRPTTAGFSMEPVDRSSVSVDPNSAIISPVSVDRRHTVPKISPYHAC